MLSFLLHVICLGVIKNGAKYHFCMRKSTGDTSKVISSHGAHGASGGLREMPSNTLGGGDKEGYAYWSTTGIATVFGRWV